MVAVGALQQSGTTVIPAEWKVNREGYPPTDGPDDHDSVSVTSQTQRSLFSGLLRMIDVRATNHRAQKAWRFQEAIKTVVLSIQESKKREQSQTEDPMSKNSSKYMSDIDKMNK